MALTIATHSGKFHADDVFAVAALLLIFPDGVAVRTRDEQTIAASDIVVDVGGIYDETRNRLDHHQIGGAGARENGIPYASFGLVWKKFGMQLCSNPVISDRVDEVLVPPIDANDNGLDLIVPKYSGISPYEVSDAVRAFIPTWLESGLSVDACFAESVSCAKRIISREIKRAEAAIAGKREVEKLYAKTPDKRLIVLPEDYSWKETLSKFPEPLFVVHPQNDTWRLYAVRDNPHQFANRKDLPEAWAGLRDEEIAKVSGVPDATFVHRNRFMAVAKTKEGALALAKLALTE